MDIIDAADILPEQRPDENEASGEETEEEEEENVEEPRRRRGKERSWDQIGSFSTVAEFKSSEIHTELTAQMTRNNKHPNKEEEFQYDTYVCAYFRKRGWKSCPKTVRVGYSQTSQDIVVWSTDNEHQHELDPDYDTTINFRWTAEQEEVVRRHLQARHKRNALILRELREKNLVNGAGKLPTVAQVGLICVG